MTVERDELNLPVIDDGDTVLTDGGKEGPRAPKMFTPIGKMVAIQTLKGSNVTYGGVIIPEGSMSDVQTMVAVVIAVGPEVKQVKEGDHILVGTSLQAWRVKIGRHAVMEVQEDGILGVLLDEGKAVIHQMAEEVRERTAKFSKPRQEFEARKIQTQ